MLTESINSYSTLVLVVVYIDAMKTAVFASVVNALIQRGPHLLVTNKSCKSFNGNVKAESIILDYTKIVLQAGIIKTSGQ